MAGTYGKVSASFPRTLWVSSEDVESISIAPYRKETPVTPSKKYTLHLEIEAHVPTGVNTQGEVTLLDVDLGSDTLADLVTKAHGHLDLAADD